MILRQTLKHVSSSQPILLDSYECYKGERFSFEWANRWKDPRVDSSCKALPGVPLAPADTSKHMWTIVSLPQAKAARQRPSNWFWQSSSFSWRVRHVRRAHSSWEVGWQLSWSALGYLKLRDLSYLRPKAWTYYMDYRQWFIDGCYQKRLDPSQSVTGNL